MAGIGDTAARGAFWTILCSITNKGVTLFGQIALAWLLVPAEFGLVALALSITNIIGTLAPSGFREVLIQQQNRFEERAGQVFLLSLFLKIIVAALVVGCAPIVSILFEEERLFSLIAIAGVTLPLDALTTVYSARLNVNLRFRAIAFINLGAGIIHTGSAIALAALGFGAYSLILPLIWVKLYTAVIQRLVTQPLKLERPHLAKWKALIHPAFWFILIAVFNAIQIYGPNIVVGSLHDATVTGLFFWGFQLSTQALFVLALSLRNVLFPTLAKLSKDPLRQNKVFLKSCSILLSVTSPICLLQAFLAEPIITLIFSTRWSSAAPIVAWLSIGMITLALNVASVSVLMAKGYFKNLALLTGFLSMATIISTLFGAYYGKQETIAVTVGFSYFLANLVSGWVGFKHLNIDVYSFLKTTIFPILLNIPSCVAATLIILYAELEPLGLTITIIFSYFGIYVVNCILFQREVLFEVIDRIKRMLWIQKPISMPED